MKDHSQPEETLHNKEDEGSAAEILKYLCTGQFALNYYYCYDKYVFILFANFSDQLQLEQSVGGGSLEFF